MNNDLSKNFKKRKLSTFVANQAMVGVIAGGMAVCSPYLFAQDSLDDVSDKIKEAEEILEEVITLGSRVQGRTATEAAVPVDVIQSDELTKSGFTELGQSLQSSAPSFNFSRTQVSDGADLFRPATLRGLQPDQTLVLINGKRRHNQAIFQTANTVGGGAAGTDMNSIPLTALKSVEVLRDGAAAQYGSDAIAGVINLQLNDAVDETTGFIQLGQTGEGDGDVVSAGVNTGFELGSDGGFINVSLEYRDFDETNRAHEGWFQGDANGDFKTFFYNAALPVGNGGELYSFGGYSERTATGRGFRRGAGSAAQNVQQVYPDGFLPRIANEAEDFSFAVGFRQELGDDWHFDTSVVYGENEYGFDSENTINASIAAEYLENNPGATDAEIAENAGARSGFSGGRSFDQTTFNFDLAGSVEVAGEPLFVAVGAEYRTESASSKAGIPDSYLCGSEFTATFLSVIDAQDGDPTTNTPAGCGFQAFSGISPNEVVDNATRDSRAVYIDLERNMTDKWLLSAAGRYEDYSVSGNETSGKVATRYDFTDNFAVRGAISTGFRAPSLVQSSFQAFQTNTNAAGELERSYTAQAGSAFPSVFGVSGLDIETSKSISLGFVWSPIDSVTLTVDGYKIEIDDRIVLGGLVNRDAVAGNAEALAVMDELGVNGISFFSNAINTTTEGVDLIATYDTDFANGDLNVTLAANYNNTSIDSFNVPAAASSADVIYPPENRTTLTDGQPQQRGTLSLNWNNDVWSTTLKFNYFGETEIDFFGQNHISLPGFLSPTGDFNDTSVVKANVLVDLDVSFTINENLSLSLGGNNIFDERPDELGNDDVLGFISGGFDTGFRYPLRAVPYGFNGSSYYVKLAFNF